MVILQLLRHFFFALLLVGITEFLTFQYLPDNLKFIIQLVLIQISIYTPILKKITIIKNISCASLVSFSLFFSGLAASKETLMSANIHLGLISIAMSIIFLGSWSNELLLDMRDIEGDKNSNIMTVPTLFGNEKAWIFTNIIMYFSIISNSLSVAYLYNNSPISYIIIFIMSPLLVNLYNIKKEKYSKDSIVNYMKYSNYPLLFMLFYLCSISTFYISKS